MNIKINLKNNKKLYVQIFDEIKKRIENGELKSNSKLLSIRTLAKQLNVNPATVMKAYDLLEEKNYIYKITGSGCYVSNEFENIDKNVEIDIVNMNFNKNIKRYYDLANSYPDRSFFKLHILKNSINDSFNKYGIDMFFYSEIDGDKTLKKLIVEKFYSKHRINNIDKIKILSSSTHALDIICKKLLKPGDKIVVEGYTNPNALSIFKKYNIQIISISLEKNGINIEKFKSLLKQEKIKFLYTIPNFNNPTNIITTDTKKKELINLAKKYKFYIIEDDVLSDISFNKKLNTLKSFDFNNTNVFYLFSFSKIFLPGIRLSYVTIPNNINTLNIETSPSIFIQKFFYKFLKKIDFERYKNSLKIFYEKKYKFFKENLEQIEQIEILNNSEGGFYFWIKLPNWMDSKKLYEICLKHNLAIIPGNIFHHKYIFSNYIRVSYSSIEKEKILDAINILKKCIYNYSVLKK
ncbi:DNA-binding transcriptional MocR family regulator [Hypnocyclicus thermotrophus]|uniref:DNA-binding transcriptional MocR family regulator n=1 Tax=Hypnocyclicus thermotrophus TaxID=1627895 RepID=A0AA46DZ48_9FUSO|nr:PLP-dependent aminotransferase family protein [Hypnocyclicus thermotrophus]TDT70570.1 DNA-binding transcriptional MocR family regulator [Hypnocyclicus thermotrophus]